MLTGTMTTQAATVITSALTNVTKNGQSPRSRYLPKLLKSKSGSVSGRSSSRPQKQVMSQPLSVIWPTNGMMTQRPPRSAFIIHFGLLKKSLTEAV